MREQARNILVALQVELLECYSHFHSGELC